MNELPAFHWLNNSPKSALVDAVKIIIPKPINLPSSWAEDKATLLTRNTESDIEKSHQYFIENHPDANFFEYRIKERLDNLVGYDSYEIPSAPLRTV